MYLTVSNCGAAEYSWESWKEIQSVNPKRNQFWIFIGQTDAEAETNTLATWCEELTHL